MSSPTSAQVQRLGVQVDAAVEKFEDFFKSLLIWSLALVGAKDLLRNKQAIFTATSLALAVLFVISRRTTQSHRGTTFNCFAFLVLGYFVVGLVIDSLVPNSYCKWVIYCTFFATVTTIPDHQHIFREMKGILLSICKYSSLKNFFIQLQENVKRLFTTEPANQEQSSVNNNSATQLADHEGGRGGVGLENV